MLLLSSLAASVSGKMQQREKGTKGAREETWAAGAVGEMETSEDKAGGSKKETLVQQSSFPELNAGIPGKNFIKMEQFSLDVE